MNKKRKPSFRPKNVSIESKVVDKKQGQASIEVKTYGLDELLTKSKELVQTLEKAKTLSNELAQINFTIN